MLHVRELNLRSIYGPIGTIRNKELRTGRRHRRNFYIIGEMVFTVMDWHPTLTNTASKKVGRNLANRHADRNPFINCSKDESLGSSTRTTSHANSSGIHPRERQDKVKSSYAVPRL